MRKLLINTENPIVEIGFVISMSFLPIILSALFASANGELGYIKSLLGFFKSGELGLSILGICGTIGWLIIQTKLNLKGENFLLIVLLIFAMIAAAGTIGTNPGFGKNLVKSLHVLLIVTYLLTLWGWYKAINLKKEAQNKYEKARRNVNEHISAVAELTTIETIIGASDD